MSDIVSRDSHPDPLSVYRWCYSCEEWIKDKPNQVWFHQFEPYLITSDSRRELEISRKQEENAPMSSCVSLKARTLLVVLSKQYFDQAGAEAIRVGLVSRGFDVLLVVTKELPETAKVFDLSTLPDLQEKDLEEIRSLVKTTMKSEQKDV
jgi:hypothetical protein